MLRISCTFYSVNEKIDIIELKSLLIDSKLLAWKSRTKYRNSKTFLWKSKSLKVRFVAGSGIAFGMIRVERSEIMNTHEKKYYE